MRAHRVAIAAAALLALPAFPSPAVGGYDIAHIVKRTCEPRGPLIVADAWKRATDRNRVITEPGEVIDCPAASGSRKFQIAAGPERIGRDRHLCVYVSLLNGDGADRCLSPESVGTVFQTLMVVRTDRSARLAVVGIAPPEVERLTALSGDGAVDTVESIRIDGQRAGRLRASEPFAYFSLSVGRPSLCTGESLRLQAHNGPSQRIDRTVGVPMSTSALDATDNAAYSRSLKTLCRSPASMAPPLTAGWIMHLVTFAEALSKRMAIQPSQIGAFRDLP